MPVITIARQYGSGGRRIGRALAEKLELPYYDKELVALAAKKSGMSEEVFQKADERHTSSLLYSLVMGNYSYAMPGTAANLPLNDQLFLLQTQIIQEAARKGPCIIVSRCADYILRDFPHVFKVYLYADRKLRVQRTIEEYGVDTQKAGDIVAKVDKRRAAYCNFYTGAKWGSPENYDLCLNTGSIGLDNAAQLILRASQMKLG